MFAGGSVGANVPTRTYSAAGAGADEGPAREKGFCAASATAAPPKPNAARPPAAAGAAATGAAALLRFAGSAPARVSFCVACPCFFAGGCKRMSGASSSSSSSGTSPLRWPTRPASTSAPVCACSVRIPGSYCCCCGSSSESESSGRCFKGTGSVSDRFSGFFSDTTKDEVLAEWLELKIEILGGYT